MGEYLQVGICTRIDVDKQGAARAGIAPGDLDSLVSVRAPELSLFDRAETEQEPSAMICGLPRSEA